ncbi:hypothetical protein OROHE_002403 [Orobanche hederae]
MMAAAVLQLAIAGGVSGDWGWHLASGNRGRSTSLDQLTRRDSASLDYPGKY